MNSIDELKEFKEKVENLNFTISQLPEVLNEMFEIKIKIEDLINIIKKQKSFHEYK